MIRAVVGGSTTTDYVVNGFGERIIKTTSGGVIVYHFDQDGDLIAETDDTGTVIREYIYLGSSLVAIVDQNGTNYVHTGLRNEPEKVTNSSGTVIWQASYSPFSQATVNGDPDGDSVFYVQNIRLPGQYYDSETGLHYNYQRDYNPRSGRYLTGDPLGFGGGSLNLYAYCAGDPINWVDPTGQSAATTEATIENLGVLTALFIPYAVRAQAVAALEAIMPASRFDYRFAFLAFIVFFRILHYEHITFQFAMSVGVPALAAISVYAISNAFSDGGTGGGDNGDEDAGEEGEINPDDIDMSDTSTWPAPPTSEPTKEGPPTK